MSESLPLIRPLPKKTFQITSAPNDHTTLTSPTNETNEAFDSDCKLTSTLISSHNRSILNLTSSTLYGIYSPNDQDGSREHSIVNTPLGTGALTPQVPQSPALDATCVIRRPSVPGAVERPRLSKLQPHHIPRSRDVILLIVLRCALLFLFGIAYGVIISHLHDNEGMAPVPVNGIDREAWRYLLYWGLAGIAWGSILPCLDVLWEDFPRSFKIMDSRFRGLFSANSFIGLHREEDRPIPRMDSGLGADWNPVVRSAGAFIGIAFAIRKLPWQSTLQVSLTLALANPVLWYLLDRSKPGFLLSTTVGIFGTIALLSINPEMMPSPASPSLGVDAADISQTLAGSSGWSSRIGVMTWIASVLFCSCVCFGNIGRRLAAGTPQIRRSTW